MTTSAPPAEPETAVRTIADLPFHVLGRFQKPLAMGRVRGGQVEGISSKELFESVRDVSLGLSALGLRKGDRVALMSESRPEWILTDLGVTVAGGVTVPIYPTLSAAQARYILADGRLTIRKPDGEAEKRYLDADQIMEAFGSIFLLPVEPEWRPLADRAAKAAEAEHLAA